MYRYAINTLHTNGCKIVNRDFYTIVEGFVKLLLILLSLMRYTQIKVKQRVFSVKDSILTGIVTTTQNVKSMRLRIK